MLTRLGEEALEVDAVAAVDLCKADGAGGDVVKAVDVEVGVFCAAGVDKIERTSCCLCKYR